MNNKNTYENLNYLKNMLRINFIRKGRNPFPRIKYKLRMLLKKM